MVAGVVDCSPILDKTIKTAENAKVFSAVLCVYKKVLAIW